MPRRTHVAIVCPEIVPALLRGEKRIETRFYRSRRSPFGRIAVGDVVHFKRTGGGLVGSTEVTSVKEVGNLTARRLDQLQRRYSRRVQAPATYWAQKRRCRYGVLIGLGSLVRPPPDLAVPRQFGTGWLVLGD
jgi:ASC-1-like (ASCH) protein